jgi:hypothetical protein
LSESPADNGPRYAIYFVPAASLQLYRYGSSILGYDSYTGNSVHFPDAFGSGAVNWSELSATPRRYGFHATLKAPFTWHRPAPHQCAAEFRRSRPCGAKLRADPARG